MRSYLFATIAAVASLTVASLAAPVQAQEEAIQRLQAEEAALSREIVVRTNPTTIVDLSDGGVQFLTFSKGREAEYLKLPAALLRELIANGTLDGTVPLEAAIGFKILTVQTEGSVITAVDAVESKMDMRGVYPRGTFVEVPILLEKTAQSTPKGVVAKAKFANNGKETFEVTLPWPLLLEFESKGLLETCFLSDGREGIKFPKRLFGTPWVVNMENSTVKTVHSIGDRR